MVPSMSRFVLGALQRSAGKGRANVDEQSGALIARYPTAARRVAWGMLALVTGSAVYAVLHTATPHAMFIGAVASAAIIALVACIVVEFTRVQVAWTPDDVSLTSPWARFRQLRWDDIASVTYSPSAGWFVLRGKDGMKIRLPQLLTGLEELLDELRERTHGSVREQLERAVTIWRRRTR